MTPSKGLVNGQSVGVSGRGLAKTYHGKAETWFITECTADVQGAAERHRRRERPLRHQPRQAATSSAKGTFSTHFAVATGGSSATAIAAPPVTDSCVIGVGTVQSQGTVVRITFKAPTT